MDDYQNKMRVIAFTFILVAVLAISAAIATHIVWFLIITLVGVILAYLVFLEATDK